MEWYGPDEAWPRHGRDYFRAALNFARAAGWSLMKYSDHSFGRVVCNRDLDPSSRCEFLVLSSGSGSETKALELRTTVDRCPHKRTSARARPTAAEIASGLLDEADKLIDAAQRCLTAGHMSVRALELLESATEATAGAGEALDQDDELERALELEGTSQDEQDIADGLASDVGYPQEAPVEAAPLLAAASERIADAERRLGPPSYGGRERAKLRRRAAETRAKIEEVRAAAVAVE